MPTFSISDKQFMKLALDEAEEALDNGNYPVGAVLVIDNQLIDTDQNRKETKQDRISHAETLLFINHSALIKKAKDEDKQVELFTTFEPCLMCLGVCVIHRIDRIVVACPDPRGDTTQIDPAKIGDWYKSNWPLIQFGLKFEPSYNLFMKYIEFGNAGEITQAKEMFKNLKEKYSQTP